MPDPRAGSALGDVLIDVDGRQVPAVVGQSVAGALHAAGIKAYRRNAVTGELRAPFCGMGVCFECELVLDGVLRRACMVEVVPNLRIRTERPVDTHGEVAGSVC